LPTAREDSDGNDGEPTTLRTIIQSVEKSGTVDFELAGHDLSRPPEVCQGSDTTDRPEIEQTPGFPLIVSESNS